MIKNLKKAFTIIELVIVIAVIAILAAVMIPTYSSLVEKANLSADEQAVKQMNTALAIYTAENGKPESASEVKKALDENDINADTIVPVTQGYAFYWNPTDNKIVLVGPNKQEPKAGWELLTSTGYVTEVDASSVDDIKNAIENSSKENPALIKLKNDFEISSSSDYVVTDSNYPTGSMTAVYFIKTGQSVILDLNKKVLTNNNKECVFAVCEGGSLTIKNGEITSSTNPRVINSYAGSVSLNSVKINITDNTLSDTKYVMFINGFADVSIINSEINNGYGYALTSNSKYDINDGARISIIGSKLISTCEKDSAGVYLPTNCNLIIDKCTISGYNHGLYLRGCSATISNSYIYNTNKDGQIVDDGWYGGPKGYSADIVFACGKNSDDGYIDNGNYTCENVTGNPSSNVENSEFTVIVHQPEGGTASVSGINVDKNFYKDKQSEETWN